MAERERSRPQPGRIGPWRLLDLAQATTPLRGGLIGGGAILPEYGPPDTAALFREPEHELPDSNIETDEQAQAVQRERARRFVRTQRPGR